jgi:multidrug resistance efflux pump
VIRFVTVCTALALAAGCGGRGSSVLVISGIVESRQIHAGSRVGGRVVAVLVEEGQTVEAGTLLVKLEARELEAERDQLRSRRGQAAAFLEKLEHGFRVEEIEQAEANAQREAAVLLALQNGPRPEEIRQAAADAAAAAAEAANARAAWDRAETLHKTGDIPRKSYDDAKARRESTYRRADSASQRLELLRAGTRKEDIAAAEARLAQARANAKLVRAGFRAEEISEARARLSEAEALIHANAERLAELEIRTPSRARVETVSVRPGDVVAPNRTLVTLLEPEEIWVRAYVPEPKLGSVKAGQAVRITTDSLRDKSFRGVIVQVASQAEFLPRNVQTREDREYQVFAMRIRPDEGRDVLKPGMAAEVRVE